VRFVLDTNVLLSAFFTRGVCEALLDACILDDTHTIFVSEHILSEFSRHARTKFRTPDPEVQLALAYLRRHTQFVEPAPIPADSCRDAQDLPILGAAVAARADVLVTGDADLLTLISYQSIPILSPRTIFDRLL